ncbi:3-deoxy-7-phosphoheptulonate synthase [Natranaerobius thermophilus]|uniref:3-deoxy-D-arabinoheptulosonate-7-phosphate synthase n=1 Tax=Natranaerobius thermophilus (strain ATCC BAA-1301 / DSM 18059 / JW/NM-WN-LF) TaxID=457570 RepID=B2A726_NATTJ|nr:3-deoxy-7-phosphoheptulonate synthase [Natranaerobius thermophilus]ACB85617.1 3-deoxy-D-arabinoheptulosonate-7-phosphate synthase [Natranaerobius thermophilus JW/NM-WN-LF]
MIIVMNRQTQEEKINKVINRLSELELECHISKGKNKIVIGVIGENKRHALEGLEALPYVEQIVPISKPFKLVSREFKEDDTQIAFGGKSSHVVKDSSLSGPVVGGNNFSLMAGPCAIENKENTLEIAQQVKQTGAQFLRGGAFKPRTSPYSFQGLGADGLKIMWEASQKTGLKIITEVMDPRQIELVSDYAHVLQIGARNMQNFELLKEAGNSNHPVLLKRGMSATIEEWLMAAEYILSKGNYKVMLCERGIRTFETATRNTLDLSAVALVKQLSHLPVIVDPSHGTGKWKLVPSMSKAALAAGADGLIIEVHSTPETALSDGSQSLTPANLEKLTNQLTELAPHFDKSFTIGSKTEEHI